MTEVGKTSYIPLYERLKLLPQERAEAIASSEMRRFIQSKGNHLRFDHYMRHHLLDPQLGFYNHVDISENGNFITDASNPNFATLVSTYLEKNNLQDFDFYEIGGGTGEFKRNFLKRRSDIKYVSIEPSHSLAKLQSSIDGRFSIKASAVHAVPQNGAPKVIFGYEVLDALPCRVFQIKNTIDGTTISKEGYVTTRGYKSLMIYDDIEERDPFIEEYETFLRSTERRFQDGETISNSPEIGEMFTSFDSSMSTGRILLFDYGYGRNHNEVSVTEPFSVTAKGIAFNAQSVLERPFYNDCTYNIDFEYCKWKTKLINPQTNVYYEPQGQFLKNIVEEDKSNKLQPTNLTTSSNEHYQVLIITK